MHFSQVLSVLTALAGTAIAYPSNRTAAADVLAARDKWAFKQSTLTIKLYENQASCYGTPVREIINLNYGFNNLHNLQSYQLSRPLAEGELLDFSTSRDPKVTTPGADGVDAKCTQFITRTTHEMSVANKVGCYSLLPGKTASCFRLWHD